MCSINLRVDFIIIYCCRLCFAIYSGSCKALHTLVWVFLLSLKDVLRPDARRAEELDLVIDEMYHIKALSHLR